MGDAVQRIASRRLLLPAIQRELVWKPDQITDLWDSLLRHYPISSFLFWRIPEELKSEVRLYDFLTDFDVREPHNPPYTPLREAESIAVLDGQQRLSAFNIGLRGSYREKLPRKRWSNPDAFPKRVLHLRLDKAPEEGMAADAPEYDFAFLTENEVKAAPDEALWFPVPDSMDMTPEGIDAYRWLSDRDRADDDGAMERLYRLLSAVHRSQSISHYDETSDSLDHVLNIFIRVNSGGTPLAFSDLLLSLATAEWQERDARREVARLQDEMNEIGQGFGFGRDRILKASLVLSDFENIKFRAENFRSRNMQQIEEQWPRIRKYLLLATQLMADFGLSERTLTAENAIIPVAYYLQSREAEENYLQADAIVGDRRTIRKWLFSTFLRGGYWTGAVDPILIEFRSAIQAKGSDNFPLEDFETRVRRRSSKSTVYSEEEIDELLELAYGDRTTFLALSLIFPEIDVSHGFDVDHLHPKSAFYKRATDARGLSAEEAAVQKAKSNQLPNLQLLPHTPNLEKGKTPLADWFDAMDPTQRDGRFHQFLVGGLPLGIEDFETFFDQRAKRMRERLVAVLNVEDE